ncbi:MAG: helix-turn-helix domain-containing protein [Thermomicrobia bacterium]|nr:helix-turn-helix domain-containing protein [Thermomicrobia bacterium]
MSIKLMAMVWEYQFTRPEQSIMLALADHAQDDGTHVYPSVARIAWKTDYSERQVQRILRDLEAKGIVVPVKHGRGGRNHATEYHLFIEKGDKKTPFQTKGDREREKGDTGDAKGDIAEVKGDTMMSPEPSSESPHESKESSKDTARSRAPLAASPTPLPIQYPAGMSPGYQKAMEQSERDRERQRKARMR